MGLGFVGFLCGLGGVGGFVGLGRWLGGLVWGVVFFGRGAGGRGKERKTDGDASGAMVCA